MFNSLKYAKQLIEAGFSREQAETQMSIMGDLMETKLAMKDDVEKLRTEMVHRFDLVDQRFVSLKSEIAAQLAELETRLFKNLSGMMAVMLTLFTAIIKLL